MKKYLLSFALVASIFGGFTACSEQAKWNRSERQAMRELLRDYRKMVYLNDLTEAEYMLFADRVIASVEEEYPVYTTFIEMPAVNDTVQVYVVTTIVEQLAADASNMRHLYPYRDLVASNVLPNGLTRSQQNAFYQCFANAVDNTYSNAAQLVNAIVADTVQTSQIAQMQAACANELFGWTVEIIEVGN
ncbi:MAG: hypothetical protein IKU93_04365 [Alistipes sp.]|nr:hypothetical protein [Alistipes sp.]